MSDMFDLPSGNIQRDIFYASSSLGNAFYETWSKPRGCHWIHVFAIGGAGGGGGGLSGTTGTARGGGSGGGAGAVGHALFPAALLPDVLYISVGLGGPPSGNNTIGNAGAGCYVETVPGVVVATGILQVTGGGAGQKGTATAATAGAASTASTQASHCTIGQLGVGWYNVAGPAGGAGGTGAATGGGGGAITILTSIVSGGAGGGGVGLTDTTANDGGNMTGAGPFATTVGGTGHAAVPTINGLCGQYLLQPFTSTGGSGGGCNGDATLNSGLAGIGGDGYFGSGGGGGGGGITGASGGKGGDGIVIITSW